MNKIIECKDRASLFDAVANVAASQITRGIEKFGRASVIVPGGTTPAPMFERLSNMSLDWHNVLIAPSDERWLDASHEASNQRLIEQNLLINHAGKATVMPLKTSAQTAQQGEAQAAENISQLQQPFSITIVGMGNDGHFASLFPGTPQLKDALRLDNKKPCTAIDATGCPVAGNYTERMSLTLSAIVNSQLVVVLITGKEKLDVVKQAIAAPSPLEKPIGALFAQTDTDVLVYWAE